MNLREVLDGVNIIYSNCDFEKDVTGVECDSRKIRPGALFIAIKGYETDGNRYIQAALAAGACAVISEDEPLDKDIPFIKVKNARHALADAAANFYRHPGDTMKLIGVTGTNGKTTITYLLKSVLESQGARVGLIGTNQNMIGDQILKTERTTPDSGELQLLLRKMADSGCTHVVMEVSSHSLVLDRVRGLHYSVGVFTNLTQDHLDFHKTMDEYVSAKALLFRQCRIGVVNLDDAAGQKIMELTPCEYVTYSAEKNSADVVAKNIRLKPASVEFEAVGFDTIGRLELHVPGRFSVYNALAAATVLLALNYPLPEISKALRQVKGVKGRAEVVPTDTEYTVMIDYAHSPDGLENILKTVHDFAEGRVVVVFGCGGDRDKTKRPKMGAIAAKYGDFVIVTSDNPRTEEPEAIIRDILPGVTKHTDKYKVITDRREAIFYALDSAKQNDVIVLAGKGHETYQEINHVKHHMDEREIIADYFNKR